MKRLLHLAALACGSLFIAQVAPLASGADTPRQIVVRAILAEGAAQKTELINSLVGTVDVEIVPLLIAWRTDALFLFVSPDGTKIPVQLTGDPDSAGARAVLRIDTGGPLLDESGKPRSLTAADLTPVKHNTPLRKALKAVLDIVDIASPDEKTRLQAIQNFGLAQDAEKLPALRARVALETSPRVQVALHEAIALIQLKDPADETRLAALRELEALNSIASKGVLTTTLTQAETAGNAPVAAAARRAIRAIDSHLSFVNFVLTIFRGISSGSVLLVVALGLAITFGLMGVINMAHGEMIAVGAYTTYLVQKIFSTGVTLPCFGLSLNLPGMNLTGAAYQSYFLFALPLSFLAAALVGIALERSVIQFLYRRPLESLLATWGVSLILQQTFRLTFGANNVDVPRPSYLEGNWTANDLTFTWPSLFVIGFAVVIVVGIWLVLTKTPLGLLIRAVMQNRNMASCMGVRTARVNMLTFGLGSGLAGLAGAFVSQIDNVGPSLGQGYIIDSFMAVVVGGVGNIGGMVISAFGISAIDQTLQQYLPAWAPGLAGVPYLGNFLQNLGQDSAVFGKILVLCLIILFLQWRPAGIFVTRSRSLEG